MGNSILRRVFTILVAGMLLGPPSGLAQEESSKVAKGKTAPDFTMTGIDGKSFKLSERIGKDKNIVIMFSRASW